ncbi:MAG: hypothetical protein QF724_12085 [Planctomycetota bacterium]|nr:hypothetical protein [Planctomycetota bacterium]MDP6518792.1 hypothetical protein [Planctomycetota bacterium]MDP6839665.1 hypothetical protein [Planctomycetota bacterium]MDP6956183.1 hypothetical protein [Planctomycetota bacterium]
MGVRGDDEVGDDGAGFRWVAPDGVALARLYPPCRRAAGTGPRQLWAGPIVLDANLSAAPLAGQVLSGSTWYFQAWFRDPVTVGTGGAGFNLSNGLEVAFVP